MRRSPSQYSLWLLLALVVALATPARAAEATTIITGTLPPTLVWDQETKEHQAKPGEVKSDFVFHVTNTTTRAVYISNIVTSCGCTVPAMPAKPWLLLPGTNTHLNVEVDLRNRWGLLQKSMLVEHSEGFQTLTVKVNIPEAAAAGGMDDRARNQKLALMDRQVILRNNCAKCHVEPARGKLGEPLYIAACAICHDAEHRASMVPDLRKFLPIATRDYWKLWISYGKPGTLMPGFATNAGGPLDEAQINSLIDYLMKPGALSTNVLRTTFPSPAK